MKRLERLTALLSFLQSRRYTPISDIIDKFQVSERTVFRDINALEASGVPISFEKEKGYYILGRHFLPPLAFTLEEAKSFIFVEQLAKKYTDRETFHQFSSALEKIKNKLRDVQLDEVEELEEKVGVYIGQAGSPKYLHQVEQACSQRQILALHYQDVRGQVTQRRVAPIGMTFYGESWHLIGFCQLRNDYRDFSLARIISLTLTGEIFEEEHLSLKGYIKRLQERDND